MIKIKTEQISIRSITTLLLISIFYLSLMAILTGLKAEHVVIAFAVNFLYFISTTTKKFITAFSIFVIYGIVYDLMKVYPNYLMNDVDIKDIYVLEKFLYGIHDAGNILTPNEYFEKHNFVILDILCGIFYLNWVPVPLALGIYFFLKNKKQFLHFALTFFLVNIIGFVIYYIHPVAPPWYLAKYGDIVQFNIPGSTAGLERFDSFFNINLFSSIYSRNSNVFAALPSLHSSYPVIVLYYGLKNQLGKVNWIFGIVMIGIWFSAVYTNHHYLIDVLSGIVCAIIAILLFNRSLLKLKFVERFLIKFEKVI